MSPRIGELFSGYGGLGMGVQSVYGGTIAWHSDIDKGACKILAHRYPDVPNIGDITTVDWSQVEPVDILTGGSPCQDLSHAGRRAGMTEGTRSNLWVAMREAIATLRPPMVVWENVRGAYSAPAASTPEAPIVTRRRRGSKRTNRSLVYEGGLLALPDGGPSLRALGRVLGDLSDLGYDARWHGLRAADVGAAHGRFRVFVAATDTQGDAGRVAHRDGGVAALASGLRRGAGWPAVTGEADGGRSSADVAGRSLLPTPTTRDHKGHNQRRDETCLTGALLPTPAVNDMGEGKTVDKWDEWTATMQAKHGNGNGHGKSLAIEAQRLLPTPRATDGTHGGPNQRGSSGDLMLPAAVQVARWGDYAAAIARWERVIGRPAPEPTQTSTKGNPQLSARFVEWLMGLPAGWVTDVPGLTRNEALKALGNGVVPQQAAEALRVMAGWSVAA